MGFGTIQGWERKQGCLDGIIIKDHVIRTSDLNYIKSKFKIVMEKSNNVLVKNVPGDHSCTGLFCLQWASFLRNWLHILTLESQVPQWPCSRYFHRFLVPLQQILNLPLPAINKSPSNTAMHLVMDRYIHKQILAFEDDGRSLRGRTGPVSCDEFYSWADRFFDPFHLDDVLWGRVGGR